MDINDIRKQTTGKRLSFHDSWDGHPSMITVENAYIGEHETMFVGVNQWGKQDRIYITNRLVDDLLYDGKAKEVQTVEHCNVIKRYELN